MRYHMGYHMGYHMKYLAKYGNLHHGNIHDWHHHDSFLWTNILWHSLPMVSRWSRAALEPSMKYIWCPTPPLVKMVSMCRVGSWPHQDMSDGSQTCGNPIYPMVKVNKYLEYGHQEWRFGVPSRFLELQLKQLWFCEERWPTNSFLHRANVRASAAPAW